MFTHKARVAIELFSEILGIQEGDEILVPSYNCGSEIDPFLDRGAALRPYEVDRNLRASLSGVTRRFTSRTKCVYLTHYFGWAQPETEAISAACRARGIPLVEDCALTLFDARSGRVMSGHGDLMVFNFTKWFGVPDGGALVSLRPGLKLPKATATAPFIATWTNLFRLIARDLRTKRRVTDFSTQGPPAPRSTVSMESEPVPVHTALTELPRNYYFDKALRGRAMSWISRRVANSMNPVDIIERRRQNYNRIHHLVQDVNTVRPLMGSLPGEVCPLNFPILVEDRAWWLRGLRAAGIAAVPWWAGFHERMEWSLFPDAVFLKQHVIALPIHHQISETGVEYMGRTLRAMASADYSSSVWPANQV